MINARTWLFFLPILILIIGCDETNTASEKNDKYSDYTNWEKWIRSEVMQINFDTDKCIKQCTIQSDGCYEFGCYASCSTIHEQEITKLTHEVSSEGLKIKDAIISENIGKYKTYISDNDDTFVTSMGNEIIYDMLENDQNEKPKQYIDCLVECGYRNCFRADCINKCSVILS
jgi:hypothetical protein